MGGIGNKVRSLWQLWDAIDEGAGARPDVPRPPGMLEARMAVLSLRMNTLEDRLDFLEGKARSAPRKTAKKAGSKRRPARSKDGPDA
jgi:hypothetical protein